MYRYLITLAFAAGLSLQLHADTVVSRGQDPDQMQKKATVAAPALASPNEGVAEETPNQKRRRLGQAIPNTEAPNYGELIETPNHKRQRLTMPPQYSAR